MFTGRGKGGGREGAAAARVEGNALEMGRDAGQRGAAEGGCKYPNRFLV